MKPSLKRIIAILLKRSNFFFFLVSMVVFSLYIIGNFQKFLDQTQIELLGLLSFSSILCAVASLYGFIFRVATIILKHSDEGFPIIPAFLNIITFCISIFLLLFSITIRTFAVNG